MRNPTDDRDEFADEDDEVGDADEYGDTAAETVACPACGAEVYEEAEQCPRCGDYITHSSSIWAGKSWWWTLLGLLGVAGLIASTLLPW